MHVNNSAATSATNLIFIPFDRTGSALPFALVIYPNGVRISIATSGKRHVGRKLSCNWSYNSEMGHAVEESMQWVSSEGFDYLDVCWSILYKFEYYAIP